MSPGRKRISVIDPIHPALQRAGLILFRPFNFGKWFVIGFGAWLASLAKAGGGGNLGGRLGGFADSADESLTFQDWLHETLGWLSENAGWLMPAAIALAVVGATVWIVLLWLSSRGEFMFLHCVAFNVAEAADPWKAHSEGANSLWMFRVILFFISTPLLLGIAGALVWVAAQAGLSGQFTSGSIILLGVLSILLILTVVVTLIVDLFTLDFIVPLMFRRNLSCPAAWKHFGSLLPGYPGPFFLYILFRIVLKLIAGALLLVLFLATCCIACCLLSIPYLGTVLLLPVLVFLRSYSAFFLAQFGPEHDVFQASRPALVAAV
ncbi:MAG TPA: hypothetical protein VMN36_12890 [Verrucomicrobiales bacterium]|nr:hypothetical protein [Verrucomicrobiales bacterium]